MIEYKYLNNDNLKDFIFLLKIRGYLDESFYIYKYSNSNFYGGFIAYSDKEPVGCIGFVKRRMSSLENVIPIGWFNDWFVIDKYRGNNIGVRLLKAVGDYYGTACGIITPKFSGIIAPKAGYIISHDLLECKFPLNPFRVGYQKYYTNKKYTDGIIRRIIRSAVYKARSHFHIECNIVAQYSDFDPAGKLNVSNHNQNNFLREDLEYTHFILSALVKIRDCKRTFWIIKFEEYQIIGFNELLPNNLKQAVVLYSTNINSSDIFMIYSCALRTLARRKEVDQIVILLDRNTAKRFKISSTYYKERPFFTYNFDYKPGSIFHHIDKESSWS